MAGFTYSTLTTAIQNYTEVGTSVLSSTITDQFIDNSEFRIKYPRGDLGQSAGEAELFMLVEHMAGLVTKMEDRMENMMSNSVNIERLQKDMEKVLQDIEKLKDKQRSFANGAR